MTIAQLANLRDFSRGDTLMRLYELRGVLLEYRTTGAEPARIAEEDLLRVENSIKARYAANSEALHDAKFFAVKEKEEAALRKFVDSHPEFKSTTAQAWDEIARATARAA